MKEDLLTTAVRYGLVALLAVMALIALVGVGIVGGGCEMRRAIDELRMEVEILKTK